MVSVLVFLLACAGPKPEESAGEDTEAEVPVDGDADGVDAASDCDDGDATVYPGAAEACDGLDNDCDRDVDEGLDALPWYQDDDGDGHGGEVTYACAQPEGTVVAGDDCDDTRDDVHPGAPETCDEVDQDCDGVTDEDPTDGAPWYPDTDGDTWGVDTSVVYACTRPEGYASRIQDCDDTQASVSPGAPELCDGLDNNCDGAVDEGTPKDAPTWHEDLDGDGYGGGVGLEACEAPPGYVDLSGDCDETDPAVHPDAPEYCNGLDDDCDGEVDPSTSADAATWYADADGDGYGAAAAPQTACELPPGHVENTADCDDSDAEVSPDAVELCDGADNDCDGEVDPDTAADAPGWYLDVDGDGYGDGEPTVACAAPPAHVADPGDCAPEDPEVSPAAEEVCDGLDNDCDGVVDPDGAPGGSTWYADADEDGFGDPAVTEVACVSPDGWVEAGTDCDDADTDVHPGAEEVCNTLVDEDCDGTSNDCVLEGDLDAADADWRPAPADGNELVGTSIVVGDFDGNGLADVVVGAPGSDGDDDRGDRDGRVYAWPSPIHGTETLASRSFEVRGDDNGGLFGWSVLAAADTDGDGRDELYVGAPAQDGADVETGRVYLFDTALSGDKSHSDAVLTLDGEDRGSYFGYALADAGDADGDGDHDVAVGAPVASDGTKIGVGAVAVFAAPVPDTLTVADAALLVLGDDGGDQLGVAVAGGHDLDGDGRHDLALGAYLDASGGADAGSVTLFLGGLTGFGVHAADGDGTLDGNSGSRLGTSLVIVGDSDGDGYAELVTGAPWDGGAAGAAYWWPGSASGPFPSGATVGDAAATWTGAAANDLAGGSVAAAGDPDGDGDLDLLLGGPGWSPDSTADGYGAAWLLYAPFAGTQDLTSYGVRIVGDDAGDRYGTSVAGLGDVSGDGYDDWAMGGPGDDEGYTDAGGIAVVFGRGL